MHGKVEIDADLIAMQLTDLHGNPEFVPGNQADLHGNLETTQEEITILEQEILTALHGNLHLSEGSQAFRGNRVPATAVRLEVNKRYKTDGSVSLYGTWRRRGKGREYVAHLRAEEIPAERLAAYHPS